MGPTHIDLLPTELLHISSLGKALHCRRKGHGFESRVTIGV